MNCCRIITGERGEGKTTALYHLASSISSPKGFISLHEDDAYYLLNLSTGDRNLLMTSSSLYPDRIGRWSYDKKLFEKACSMLSAIDSGDVFIDEVGRLELSGKGFAPALKVLVEKPVSLYLSVRKPFLADVITAFSLQNAIIEEVEASL